MELLWYHYLLGAVLIVSSILIVVLVMLQQSQQQGLSGAIAGGSDSFFDKNKGRTKEAKLAKSLGYDAVLLSPGGLKDLTEVELLERTEAVAAEMPVIGFYLQEKCGGRPLSFDYWAKLSEIENVVAIKCASFNRYQTLDVVRAVSLSSRKDEIALYTGNDDNIVIDLLTIFSS